MLYYRYRSGSEMSLKELIYDEEFLVYDKADFTSEEEDFVKFFKIKIYDKLKEES